MEKGASVENLNNSAIYQVQFLCKFRYVGNIDIDFHVQFDDKNFTALELFIKDFHSEEVSTLFVFKLLIFIHTTLLL